MFQYKNDYKIKFWANPSVLKTLEINAHFMDEKTDIIKGRMTLSVPGQSPQTNMLKHFSRCFEIIYSKSPSEKEYNTYTMLEIYKKTFQSSKNKF